MSDWLNWIMFAAKILEVLMSIFGDEARIVKHIETRIVERIEQALDPPAVPNVKQLEDVA